MANLKRVKTTSGRTGVSRGKRKIPAKLPTVKVRTFSSPKMALNYAQKTFERLSNQNPRATIYYNERKAHVNKKGVTLLKAKPTTVIHTPVK